MRDSWITTIRQLTGDPDWEPLQSSTVCSRHFDPTMFVMTGSGGRRFIGYPDITLCLGKDDGNFGYTFILQYFPLIF